MQNIFRDYMPYPYVYLQYSSDDAEKVIPIIKDLKEKKFNIAFDKEFHIADKERILDVESISDAALLVIFYSKAASKSRLIKETVRAASHIPPLEKMCVCLDDTKFGFSFGDIKRNYDVIYPTQTDHLISVLEQSLFSYRLPVDASEGSDELIEDTEESVGAYPDSFDDGFSEPEPFEEDFMVDQYETNPPDLLVLADKTDITDVMDATDKADVIRQDEPALVEPLFEKEADINDPEHPDDWWDYEAFDTYDNADNPELPLLVNPEDFGEPEDFGKPEDSGEPEDFGEPADSGEFELPLLTEDVPQAYPDKIISDNGYLPLR